MHFCPFPYNEYNINTNPDWYRTLFLAAMKNTKIVIITGCSCIGKNTLAQKLLDMFDDLVLVRSTTTREPREGDNNYLYVSNEKFEWLINDKRFVNYSKVFSDCYYGTLESDLYLTKYDDKVKLLVVDVASAETLSYNRYCDSVVINLLPKNIEEIKKRIVEQRHDHIDERLAGLENEIRKISIFYNFEVSIADDCLEEVIELVSRKMKIKWK